MCFDIRTVISWQSWCSFISSNEPKKDIFFSTNITIMKIWFQKFSNSMYLAIFDHFDNNLYSKLLLAKVSLFVFGATLLLNRIGNLLAYIATFIVTSVYRLLILRGWVDSAWNSKYLDCSRSQIRILAEFLLNRGLILLFLISPDRGAFSCSLTCLRCAALPLYKKFSFDSHPLSPVRILSVDDIPLVGLLPCSSLSS